jgi:small-conductance mechanosensitive channel
MKKIIWRRVNMRLVPCLVVVVVGLVMCSRGGNITKAGIDHKFVALIGVIIFLIFAAAFLHILSDALRQTIIAKRLGIGRAAALQYIIRIFGYITILFVALDRVGFPIGHLLLGSAVLGIILGVAAQQALANFFASIVLILAHPFSVGEHITLVSGGLGGKYVGTVVDIGMTHTRLQEENGNIIALPNSSLLTGATIMLNKKEKQSA